MKKIIFAVFTLVYLATAVATLVAFLAQARLIPSELKEGEQIPYLGLLVSAVLVETIGGYIAIAKDIFGLKSSNKGNADKFKTEIERRTKSVVRDLEKEKFRLKKENDRLIIELERLTSLKARLWTALNQSSVVSIGEIEKFLGIDNNPQEKKEIMSLIGALIQEGVIKRAEVSSGSGYFKINQ